MNRWGYCGGQWRSVLVRNYSRNVKKSIPRKHTLSPHVAKGTFLPKGSSSVTTTLGTGRFGVLSEVTREDRELHKNILEKIDNFEELKIHSVVRGGLTSRVLGHLEVQKPTHIQTLGIKAIQAKRKNPLDLQTWLMAAETGSGKTLAYLLPLLSKLKAEKGSTEWKESMGRLCGIRSVILVPSVELITQVAEVLDKFKEKGFLFSILAATPDKRMSYLYHRLERRVDVLICTPDKLQLMTRSKKFSGENYTQMCRFMVVDEADSLMNESFKDATLFCINLMPNLTDLVFCSATIPRQFDRILRENYPNTIRLVTPKIHKLPSHVDFRVVEVFRPPYMDNKLMALKQALYAIYHDGTEEGLKKRVVVFVNRRESVDGITKDLCADGYSAFGVDGAMKPELRSALISDFIEPAQPSEKPEVNVLVTTDLMARGIDMNRIRNVILYDLPKNSADLLHRAGRTGRLNARGRVLLLVNKKESQGWVKGLEKVVKSGLSLA
jgi:ATP-dependent RNA helicase MRH4